MLFVKRLGSSFFRSDDITKLLPDVRNICIRCPKVFARHQIRDIVLPVFLYSFIVLFPLHHKTQCPLQIFLPWNDLDLVVAISRHHKPYL